MIKSLLTSILCFYLYVGLCQRLPNKQQTISYLNEKFKLYDLGVIYSHLNEDCLTVTAPHYSLIYELVLQNDSFIVVDSAERCYLKFNSGWLIKRTLNDKPVTHDLHETVQFAPIDQIHTIKINADSARTSYSTESISTCTVKVSSSQGLMVYLKSKSLRVVDKGSNKIEYEDKFFIPLREGEELLLSKIRRALINLKRYCKDPHQKDLFSQ